MFFAGGLIRCSELALPSLVQDCGGRRELGGLILFSLSASYRPDHTQCEDAANNGYGAWLTVTRAGEDGSRLHDLRFWDKGPT